MASSLLSPRLIRAQTKSIKTFMPETLTRELTMGEAIREALAEEMRRDPRVFICGEDVAEAGTVYKILSGLVDEFGPERVQDTPISEAGFTGIAVGAAMTGMRTVVDIMFGDFGRLTMVQVALGAAKLLEEYGISAEVIDPRTLWPLDEKTLIESAKKTSRVIVMDEGYGRYGVTAEIASVIAEGAFFDLEAPVKRLGAMHVPIPFSPPLEDATVPNEQTVFEAAKALCGR